jgi:hypothetical protein
MKQSEIFPVTEEHFGVFKAECLRLLQLWGMSDLRLEIYHTELDAPDTVASCGVHVLQHAARIRLNTTCSVQPDTEIILAYARHEMIHALLGPLSSLGSARCVTEDELVAAEHALLNRLSGLLPK